MHYDALNCHQVVKNHNSSVFVTFLTDFQRLQCKTRKKFAISEAEQVIKCGKKTHYKEKALHNSGP